MYYEDIIPIVIDFLFTIVLVVIAPKFYKWLQENLTTKQLNNLEIITKHAVKAVEQTITEINQGPVKKAQVIEFVTNYCEENNIELDSNLLDVIIESVVKEMNDLKKGDS